MRLDEVLPANLRDLVESAPLATYGNHVAFLLNDGTALDTSDREETVEYGPASVSLVSMPTRGTFAETYLSTCNACEQRDVSRFWRWDELPCPRPPQISGISPGPRGSQFDIGAAAPPVGTLQPSPPLAEPDPLGVGQVLEVLGRPEIFRDMSTASLVSALLNQLSRNAAGLAQRAQASAADVIRRRQELEAERDREERQERARQQEAQRGGRMSPQERYDNLQIARELDGLP